MVGKVKKVCNYQKQCTLFSFDVNHSHTTNIYIYIYIYSFKVFGPPEGSLYCFYFHRKCLECPERCLHIIYIYICIYIYIYIVPKFLGHRKAAYIVFTFTGSVWNVRNDVYIYIYIYIYVCVCVCVCVCQQHGGHEVGT